MCQNHMFFWAPVEGISRIWGQLHSAGFSFLTLNCNYFMTAAFTVKDGSPRREARVCSASAVRPSWPGCDSSKTLDCNLHRSLWSSCVDVPVLESEPRCGGWGRGGEGEQAVASIFCEERTRLVSHRSGKALSHCCFLFVHQVLLTEGNTVSVFWNSCLFLDLNIHKPAADLFILTLLVWKSRADPRNHLGPDSLFTSTPPALVANCVWVSDACVLHFCAVSSVALTADGGVLFAGLVYTYRLG